jgi:hypothetical protein
MEKPPIRVVDRKTFDGGGKIAETRDEFHVWFQFKLDEKLPWIVRNVSGSRKESKQMFECLVTRNVVRLQCPFQFWRQLKARAVTGYTKF